MASTPYEDLVVRLSGMNLWGLTSVAASVMHCQEKKKSAKPVTKKPSAIEIRDW